jgi:hypothetical protein
MYLNYEFFVMLVIFLSIFSNTFTFSILREMSYVTNPILKKSKNCTTMFDLLLRFYPLFILYITTMTMYCYMFPSVVQFRLWACSYHIALPFYKMHSFNFFMEVWLLCFEWEVQVLTCFLKSGGGEGGSPPFLFENKMLFLF